MKPTEAAALLTICATFDNRKPDRDQAQAWSLVLDGLRFLDCRDAIVAHYKTKRDWIMPSDVIQGVDRIRGERLRKFGHIPPPPQLADDPAAEIAWVRAVKERVADGEITSMAEVEDYDPGELKPRDMSSLGQIGRSVPRHA